MSNSRTHLYKGNFKNITNLTIRRNQLKNTYNEKRLNPQVIKLLIQKSKLDENETQSIQCPMNIEKDKFKRGN